MGTQVTMNNVTVALNQTGGSLDGGGEAGSGGGLYQSDSLVIVTNTLVATNDVGAGGAGPDCMGAFFSPGFNLIGDATDCLGFFQGLNGDQVGTAMIPLNPLLATLALNHGLTRTHEPQEGSRALDHGDNDTCEVEDQRGVERPQDGEQNGIFKCDVGALEKTNCGNRVVDLPIEECDDGNCEDAPQEDFVAGPCCESLALRS